MKTIAVLTDWFPFGEGEPFLETEIKFWASVPGKVVILPRHAIGRRRVVPEAVEVDLALAAKRRPVDGLRAVGVVGSRLFWREVACLWRTRRLSPMRLAILMRSVIQLRLLTLALGSAAERHGGFDLAYSYWNDLGAYASVLAKRRSEVRSVISRAHRFDLFEESRRKEYMPLKRQLAPDMDLIFCVSDDAAAYFTKRFSANPSQVRVARLGVNLPNRCTAVSPPGKLHLVSISFCSPVKRLDRLIRAIHLLAELEPELSISWTHIGGGALMRQLQAQAAELLAPHRNVTHVFKGSMSNADVLDWLRASTTDLIVNVSASEGIPVSIMEAMGFGIPAVATNVGGVRELVSAPHGMLLSADPSDREVARAIASFAGRAKSRAVRHAARLVVEKHYNAEINYPEFLRVIDLA